MRNESIHWHHAILCAGALLLFTGSPTTAGEVRTWTDVTGRHQVEAELVIVKEGIAYLHNPKTGKVTPIAVEKLSKSDRAYLANKTDAKPFPVPPVDEPKETDADQRSNFRNALCAVERTWIGGGRNSTYQHPAVLITRDEQGGLVVCDARVAAFGQSPADGKDSRVTHPESATYTVTLAAGSPKPRRVPATLVGISDDLAIFRVKLEKNDLPLDRLPAVDEITHGMRVVAHCAKGHGRPVLFSRAEDKTTIVPANSTWGVSTWKLYEAKAVKDKYLSRMHPAIVTDDASKKVVGFLHPTRGIISSAMIRQGLFPMIGMVQLHPTAWDAKGVKFDIRADILDPAAKSRKYELLIGYIPPQKPNSRLGDFGKLLARQLRKKAVDVKNLKPVTVSLATPKLAFYEFREQTLADIGKWTWKDAFGPDGKRAKSPPVRSNFVARLRWTEGDGKKTVSDPIGIEVTLMRMAGNRSSNTPSYRRGAPLVHLASIASYPQAFARDGGLAMTYDVDTPLKNLPLEGTSVESDAKPVKLTTAKETFDGLDVYRIIRPVSGKDEKGKPIEWSAPDHRRIALSRDGKTLYVFSQLPLSVLRIDISSPQHPVETHRISLDHFIPADFHLKPKGREHYFSYSLSLTSDRLVARIGGRTGKGKAVSPELVILDPDSLKVLGNCRFSSLAQPHTGSIGAYFQSSPGWPYLLHTSAGGHRVIDPRSQKEIRRTSAIRTRSHRPKIHGHFPISLDGQTVAHYSPGARFRLDGPDLVFEKMVKPTVYRRGRPEPIEWTTPDIFVDDPLELLFEFKGDSDLNSMPRLAWLRRHFKSKGFLLPEDDRESGIAFFRNLAKRDALQIDKSVASDTCIAVREHSWEKSGRTLVFFTQEFRHAKSYTVSRKFGSFLRRGRTMVFVPHKELLGSNGVKEKDIYIATLPETFDPK